MKISLFLSLLMLTVCSAAFSMPPLDEGKMIFASRCASCHNVHKTVVGPALAGVSERRTEDWIIRFVHSSQTVIRGGDKTASELYEKFNKVTMPDHRDLSSENIKNILDYIQAETKIVPATIAFRPDKIHPAYRPISISNWKFFSGYTGLIILLAASMVLLVRVKEIQRKQGK
jgi:cytochrome c551/c552